MVRSRRWVCALLAATLFSGSGRAADRTWDNGAANFIWNTTDPAFSGPVWSNAAGDGAIFGSTGVGAIAVPGPINANSLSFTADGYSFTGAGPLTFVTGTSTLATGVVSVATGATAQLSVPVTSAVNFQKLGAGTLILSGAGNFTGATAVTGNGSVQADVLVGTTVGTTAGGTLRVTSQSALPATTNVSIGAGYLDIGANTITLNSLTFTNQNVSGAWNTTLNANNGVIGSGTLRVTGDIHVLGVTGGNPGNTIAANVDLGGGTQIVRVGATSSFGLNQALMFTGTLSNGSLLKSLGFTNGGTIGSIDGMSLFGNNTYTGSSTFNSGTNVATGTNASTSIKVVGIGGPGGSSFILQGANGSFQSATTIQSFASATFILDNNAALGASGNNVPNIPAAQNNNRIRDDAAVELRDASFTYRGQSTIAASETYGSLSVSGGFNTLTITPNGTGGTATLTAAGNLTMAARSTLLVSGTTLSAAGKVFFNGTIPTADATGILPRIVASADFVTYNGTTGVTPYTGYATDFSTAGTNVALTASPATAPTVSINALKTTGTFTTTIGAGNTLAIGSGMLLNTSGTHTIAGATLAFAANPGIFFGGTTTVSAAITGSAGLIVPNSTVTLSGNMAGLTGTVSVQNGTLTVGTNTLTAPIEVRQGTLNFNVTQTGAGLGAITLGVPQNDANLSAGVPTYSFSGAAANAVIDRPLIVDNGAFTAAGLPLSFSLLARLSPLSNATGSQTLNGNITLNSNVNLQGGGGGGTGATNFTGAVSGVGTFYIPNGRVNFTATSNLTNTGGYIIGNAGNTMQVSFLGATSGTVPVVINGGNNNMVGYAATSLPQGPITVQNASGTTAPQLIPLATSTINNAITLNGDAIANVGAGLNATWAGSLTGTRTLTKNGTGTLTLSNATNTFTGPFVINAGALSVTGATPAASTTVNAGGVLQGTGTLTSPVTVNVGGVLKGGASIGTLTVSGNVALTSAASNPAILRVEGDLTDNSKVNVTGTFQTFNLAGLTGSNVIGLDLVAPGWQYGDSYTWELVRTVNNANGILVNSATNFGVVPAANYTLTTSAFIATNVTLTANADTLVIQFTAVPEPTWLLLVGAAAVVARRRRRV